MKNIHSYWGSWRDRLCDQLTLTPYQSLRSIKWILEHHGIRNDLAMFEKSLDVLFLDSQKRSAVEDMLARLLKGEPLSKLFKNADFYGRTFITGPDTLDPRLDTEVMITYAKHYFDATQSLHFLDLGTGTGCIAITLLLEFPKAQVTAVDLCEKALETAYQNARLHQVDHRMTLMQSHWFSSIKQSFEQESPRYFDGIFSNPPYIEDDYPLDVSVKDYDPHLALFGGKDGLDAYRILMPDLQNYMHEQSVAILEMGFDQKDRLIHLGQSVGLVLQACLDDDGGHTRALVWGKNPK